MLIILLFLVERMLLERKVVDNDALIIFNCLTNTGDGETILLY